MLVAVPAYLQLKAEAVLEESQDLAGRTAESSQAEACLVGASYQAVRGTEAHREAAFRAEESQEGKGTQGVEVYYIRH
jgi:hypothetical protein